MNGISEAMRAFRHKTAVDWFGWLILWDFGPWIYLGTQWASSNDTMYNIERSF